jgi:hypothetical protein
MISFAKSNCLASDRLRRSTLFRNVGNERLGSESGFASTSGGWVLDGQRLNIRKALGDPISGAVSQYSS